MNSPSMQGKLTPKREPFPEPDVMTYHNNMESAQYQVVGGNNKSYISPSLSSDSEKEEITKSLQKSRNHKCKCRFDFALAFALTVTASIVSTAFLTYQFLKMNYKGCLTAEMLQTLRTTQILRAPRDCKEHYDNGALVDGLYRVYPEKTTFVNVYCDMKNGGWTVIQKRMQGNEEFDRSWIDYVEGFGNLSRDHWMGLKYQHLFTKHENQYEISFEFLMKDSGKWAKGVYESFFVDNEETNFTVRVSPRAEYNTEMKKEIDHRNGFYYHNGMKFTTTDVDHDVRESQNCAQLMKCGGFWYSNCIIFCINGRFDHMFLFEAASLQKFFSKTVVKIKPYE